MRAIATIIATIGLVALVSAPAHAYGPWIGPEQAIERSWGGYHGWQGKGYPHHARRHHVPRQARHGRSYSHRSYSGLPGPCYVARRQGGPCGCVAMGHIFGRYDHVLNGMNLWLARTWLGFPRTSPAPGMAAVWGAHHVEAIVATNGDGTITTSGPYGNRRVRIGSVTIVNPHGGYAGHRESRHYASRHRRHQHFARAW